MRYCSIRKNKFSNLITMTLKWYLANERIILNWKDINHINYMFYRQEVKLKILGWTIF